MDLRPIADTLNSLQIFLDLTRSHFKTDFSGKKLSYSDEVVQACLMYNAKLQRPLDLYPEAEMTT